MKESSSDWINSVQYERMRFQRVDHPSEISSPPLLGRELWGLFFVLVFLGGFFLGGVLGGVFLGVFFLVWGFFFLFFFFSFWGGFFFFFFFFFGGCCLGVF